MKLLSLLGASLAKNPQAKEFLERWANSSAAQAFGKFEVDWLPVAGQPDLGLSNPENWVGMVKFRPQHLRAALAEIEQVLPQAAMGNLGQAIQDLERLQSTLGPTGNKIADMRFYVYPDGTIKLGAMLAAVGAEGNNYGAAALIVRKTIWPAEAVQTGASWEALLAAEFGREGAKSGLTMGVGVATILRGENPASAGIRRLQDGTLGLEVMHEGQKAVVALDGAAESVARFMYPDMSNVPTTNLPVVQTSEYLAAQANLSQEQAAMISEAATVAGQAAQVGGTVLQLATGIASGPVGATLAIGSALNDLDNANQAYWIKFAKDNNLQVPANAAAFAQELVRRDPYVTDGTESFLQWGADGINAQLQGQAASLVPNYRQWLQYAENAPDRTQDAGVGFARAMLGRSNGVVGADINGNPAFEFLDGARSLLLDALGRGAGAATPQQARVIQDLQKRVGDGELTPQVVQASFSAAKLTLPPQEYEQLTKQFANREGIDFGVADIERQNADLSRTNYNMFIPLNNLPQSSLEHLDVRGWEAHIDPTFNGPPRPSDQTGTPSNTGAGQPAVPGAGSVAVGNTREVAGVPVIRGSETRIDDVGARAPNGQGLQGALMAGRTPTGEQVFWLQGRGTNYLLDKNADGSPIRNQVEAEARARQLISGGAAGDLQPLDQTFLTPGAGSVAVGNTREVAGVPVIRGSETRIDDVGARAPNGQGLQGALMAGRTPTGEQVFWLQGRGTNYLLDKNADGSPIRNQVEAETRARELISGGAARDLQPLDQTFLTPGAGSVAVGNTREVAGVPVVRGSETRIDDVGARAPNGQGLQGALMAGRTPTGEQVFWLQGRGTNYLLDKNADGSPIRNQVEAEARARQLISGGAAGDLQPLDSRYLGQ